MVEDKEPRAGSAESDVGLVHMGAKGLDMRYILPRHVTDEDVMKNGFPLSTIFQGSVQRERRVGIPKSIYDGLMLSAGDEVVVALRVVKKEGS